MAVVKTFEKCQIMSTVMTRTPAHLCTAGAAVSLDWRRVIKRSLGLVVHWFPSMIRVWQKNSLWSVCRSARGWRIWSYRLLVTKNAKPSSLVWFVRPSFAGIWATFTVLPKSSSVWGNNNLQLVLCPVLLGQWLATRMKENELHRRPCCCYLKIALIMSLLHLVLWLATTSSFWRSVNHG